MLIKDALNDLAYEIGSKILILVGYFVHEYGKGTYMDDMYFEDTTPYAGKIEYGDRSLRPTGELYDPRKYYISGMLDRPMYDIQDTAYTGKTIQLNTVVCRQCRENTPNNSQFCIYCGNNLM